MDLDPEIAALASDAAEWLRNLGPLAHSCGITVAAAIGGIRASQQVLLPNSSHGARISAMMRMAAIVPNDRAALREAARVRVHTASVAAWHGPRRLLAGEVP